MKVNKSIISTYLLLLLVSVIFFGARSVDGYDVLGDNADQLLNRFLIEEATRQFEKRDKSIAHSLAAATSGTGYIEHIQRKFSKLFSFDTVRTSLNAVVTGTIEGEAYTIEKIYFESRANHFITGNLYRPKSDANMFPAVLIACGHSAGGKAGPTYQRMAASLARNGIIAFVIDTYNQGEMLQMHSADNQLTSPGSGSTVGHTQLDIGSMLIGGDLVFDQLWNNMRAIDYLIGRPDVDPHRVGVTGNSGGGTQALFLLAADSRVKVGAPSCALQTRKRMFSLNGPADGCHHVAMEGKYLPEYADYLLLSLPKPVLILAAEKDEFFDIDAVSRSVREAKWFYKQEGIIDRIQLFSTDGKHSFHEELRDAAVMWFLKWFEMEGKFIREPNSAIREDQSLWATESGQTLTSFRQAKSLSDVNCTLAERYEADRRAFWTNGPELAHKAMLLERLGIDKLGSEHMPIVKKMGRGRRLKRGTDTEKLVIVARDGFPIPALASHSAKSLQSDSVVIFVGASGKKAVQASAACISALRAGKDVLIADLRGFGETEDNPGDLRLGWRAWNNDHRIAQTALHIGRPLIGQRTQDIIDIVNCVSNAPNGKDYADIEIYDTGDAELAILHAAALDRRISSINLRKNFESWSVMIKDPLLKDNLSRVVPGALKYYDISDLVSSIGTDRISIGGVN